MANPNPKCRKPVMATKDKKSKTIAFRIKKSVYDALIKKLQLPPGASIHTYFRDAAIEMILGSYEEDES